MLVRLFKTFNQHKYIYIAILVLLVILLSLGAYQLYLLNSGSVPASIEKKLTFSPLVIPDGTTNYSVSNYKLTKTDNGDQIISYIVHTKYGIVSISQQSQPPQFVEIPEYKDRFLENVAQQYDSVQSSSGTIYLGRLPRQNNKQLGIMLEKGLLVFMNPDKQLDLTQWRGLGDQLELLRVSN